MAINLTSDRSYISLGFNADNFVGGVEDHRYIFSPAFRVISIDDGATIESSMAPTRDITIAPPGRKTSKIIRIGGTIGGTGGIGGWYNSIVNLIAPAAGTYIPDVTAIASKDDAENVLQRIANVCTRRGMGNLRLGHGDNRWIPVVVKSFTVTYIDGTDRNAFDVMIEFEAPDPAFIGNAGSIAFATDCGDNTFTVGGTTRTWPVFDMQVNGVAPIWIGVRYAAGLIVMQLTPRAFVGTMRFYTNPRKRGIWTGSTPQIQDRDYDMTARLNCMNTVGDDELMPYFLPGTVDVIWQSSAAGLNIYWDERYAF